MEDSPESSQQDDIPVGQWSLTQTKQVKCNYTWTIDNFKLQCEEAGEMIKSPCFSIEGNDNIKWRLDLYPKGRNEGSRGFVSLFLKLVACGKSEVIASYVFSILNNEYIQKKAELQTKHFKQGTSYGYHNFIGTDYLLDQSNGLLPEDKLTICCEVSLKGDTVDISGQGVLVQVQNPRGYVSNDVCNLYNNMTLSDVTLVAGGKGIRAHKVILAARSAVFAAMFEHDMQEQKLSRVDITDVDHDTLTEILRYIYTDCAPNLDKMADDLLVAADKYVLDRLKVQCEEALCRNLSVETAAVTLVLADLHSVELLKKQTIAFINSRHVGMVMETEGWKKMISTHPHLVNELFSKMTVLLQQHLPISAHARQGDLVQVKNPRGSISDDFGKLFDNKTLSDVTLVAGGKGIRAHKVILAARSAVFAAMFEEDMQEQKLSRVDITDVDHDTLVEMLSFIYTDQAPNLDTMAADLLVAADKYALDRLKVMCEEALCRNLSVETAANTLILADLYSVERLKEQTIVFINLRHVGMVMETEGWKKMISTHPQLVAELFSKMTVMLQQHLPISPMDQDIEVEDDEAKSEATFRYIVENFKDLDGRVLSPPCYVRNLPWKIMVEPREDKDKAKTLGFFLQCNTESKSSSWSCYAIAELKLLSHKPETEPVVHKIQHLFNSKENDWGYYSFMKWSDVLDPENGYVKDNAITLEVHVSVGVQLL